MNDSIAIGASWVQAIGTVMSAVGSTPLKSLSEQTRTDLNIWGNVLQASGNALEADQEKEITLGKVGNQVQATGNTIVFAGLVLAKDDEETKGKLSITGNLFQAAGGLMAVVDDMEDTGLTASMRIVGDFLQAIGNSLQAIGDKEGLKDHEEEGEQLNFLGSWIQAIGSVLTALAATREFFLENPGQSRPVEAQQGLNHHGTRNRSNE